MGTGSLVAGEQQLGKSNYNHKFILAEDGATIEAMAAGTKFAGMVCSPTTNGASLLKGHLYVWDAINSVWIDQQNPVHTHSSTAEGGLLKDILIANDPFLWYTTEAGLAFQATSGTAPQFTNSVVAPDAYRLITTAASSLSAGTLSTGGLLYDMAFKLVAHFRATMTSSTASAYTTRAGFNMEFAHTTAGAAKKLGIEACDTCAGAFIRVVSADGTTRSASNTTDDATIESVYKIVFNPSTPNLTYTKNNGTVVVKTSNMPTTGTPSRSNTFVMGIMTGTATAKTMRIHGLRAYGTISSESSTWV